MTAAIQTGDSTNTPLDFSGRVAIITGGTRGVGRGIASEFLKAGAEVVVCGRKNSEQLPEYGGRRAIFQRADVRRFDEVQQLINSTAERFGRLDVLVNNAGGSPMVAADSASPRFTESIIQLNLIAPIFCSQNANSVMQKQPSGGCIINIASVSAIRPSPLTAAYGAAKGGLVNLTASLAIEWAPKVRVNTIISGLIHTEQAHLHYGDQAGIAAVAKTIPAGRMGQPTDIANCCLYLASPLASWVTGAAVPVHGGGEVPQFLAAGNAPQPE